jgi:hypothetical protein
MTPTNSTALIQPGVPYRDVVSVKIVIARDESPRFAQKPQRLAFVERVRGPHNGQPQRAEGEKSPLQEQPRTIAHRRLDVPTQPLFHLPSC